MANQNAKIDENHHSTLIGIKDDGSGETIRATIDPVTGRLRVSAVVASGVTGPASSTNNALPRFNGTAGDTIKDSLVVVDDSGNAMGVKIDANGSGNAVTNIETADLASSSKSGVDATVVTGTKGTDGNLLKWNADGDAVDSTVAASGLVTASSSNTFTNKTFDANGTGNSLSNVETADIAASSKSGADATVVTGTKGTDGNLLKWNADGDAIDAGIATISVVASSSVLFDKSASIQVIDGLTDTSVADGQAYITIPSSLNGMNLVGIAANVITAGNTGTTDIQVRNVTDAVDMLSTKMTIDSGETSTATAATPAVIDTSHDDVATGDVIAIDVDAISTTPAKGLIVNLIFHA